MPRYTCSCGKYFMSNGKLNSHKTTCKVKSECEEVESKCEESECVDNTFIDLFCGIGGFHQALQKFGYRCTFACDIDLHCRDTYKKNYDMEPFGDINKINISEIPSFEVLCAGFPCQSFSKAGNQRGFEDKIRGTLFFNICEIIKCHRPKYLLLENVKNLTTHDDGNTWETIKSNINELGYFTYEDPVVFNVLHFNIPQNRERVVIMCKRKDIGILHPLPEISKNPKKKLSCFIRDIICDVEDNEKYRISGKMKHVEKIWDKFIKILASNDIDIPKFPIWTDWWDNVFDVDDPQYLKYKNWIDKNILFYQNNFLILNEWLISSRNNHHWVGAVRKFEWQAGDTHQNDGMNSVLWTARSSGIRVKRTDYIPTLVAMSHIPVYGPESRRLSPRELLRLQSFPDNFVYDEKHIYKQIGNAVNVTMIEKCFNFLVNNVSIF